MEISPEAPERCHGEDDDCDGDADEAADVVDAGGDLDGDGFDGWPLVGGLGQAWLSYGSP